MAGTDGTLSLCERVNPASNRVMKPCQGLGSLRVASPLHLPLTSVGNFVYIHLDARVSGNMIRVPASTYDTSVLIGVVMLFKVLRFRPLCVLVSP
jgi:hypothetical protein